jgi:hypothetical protein
MISPLDIEKKALRQYKAFLTAVIKRNHFFPLAIKGNKGKANQSMDILFPALKRLLEGAKAKKGYGYTVTLKTIQTRHAGEMTMPDQIYFENVEDYVKFIGKEKEFLAFRKVVMQSQKQLPTLIPWMEENPLKVIKYLDKWTTILSVGQYFQDNPRPNKYIRALPIEIPSTFIEQHQPILKEILEAILPQTAINQNAVLFEKRFGLKYEEALIRIRTLDGRQLLTSLLTDVSLTLSAWQQLEFKSKTIFICTDLLNFLRFPDHPDSLIIYGDAACVKVLHEWSFLKDKNLYFWGDITIQHFQVLTDLRQHFPNLNSFLMDEKTFKKHQEFATKALKDTSLFLPKLTEEEQLFLDFLAKLEENNSLLQQHISQKYLKKRLGLLL